MTGAEKVDLCTISKGGGNVMEVCSSERCVDVSKDV